MRLFRLFLKNFCMKSETGGAGKGKGYTKAEIREGRRSGGGESYTNKILPKESIAWGNNKII